MIQYWRPRSYHKYTKACLPTSQLAQPFNMGHFPPFWKTHLGRKGLHHPSMMDHPGRFARFANPERWIESLDSAIRRDHGSHLRRHKFVNKFNESSTTKGKSAANCPDFFLIPKPEWFGIYFGGNTFPDTSRTPIILVRFSQPENPEFVPPL